MALIKRSDWPGGSWLSDFFDDDRFFDSGVLKRSMPAVNVRENDKTYEIELAAPGLTKKDFKITVDNGVLTVSAEKQEEKEKKEDHYTRKEFGYTSFSRSFSLPVNVNEEDIQAQYTDGVLKLSISKKGEPEAKPKKAIEVK